jgi:hypothetical protein
MYTRPGAASAALAVALVLLISGPASAQGWGTIKGQVVFSGKVPPNPQVVITADKDHCSSKGPIHRNELVVNPKNKGVRWVLVWLAPVKDFNDVDKVPPIHPSLRKVPEKVEIDQPVCRFIPRMTAMREGTVLMYKNSAPVPHNVSINGGPLGPNLNQLLPAGKGELVIKDVKARFIPFSFGCSIHVWMKGWIGVFKHPYYAVTDADGKFEIKDAPAGKWRLILWQEKVGFVIQKSPKDRGKIIEVKNKGTTDLKTIPFKDVED